MTANLILPGSRRIQVDLGRAPYDAILDAVRTCERTKVHPVRLDADDWVTLGDVALRVGVSRELVRLWSIGRQGPGRFPPPLNPGCGTSFYSWTEVREWIHANTCHDVGDLNEPVLAAMNLALQLRHMSPQLTRLDAVVKIITV